MSAATADPRTGQEHVLDHEVWHVSCPSCGGTLPRPAGAQLLDCTYCGARCLLRGADLVQHAAILPRMQHSDLRALLAPLLTNPNTPDDLIDRAVPRQIRLFFVPFFEISGKKAAVRRQMRDARWSDDPSKFEARTVLFSDSLFDKMYQERRGQVRDMVVSLTDFYDFMPACSMPEFGVEHARVADVRGGASSIEPDIVPFDPVALNRLGIVVSITRSLSSYKQGFAARIESSSGSGDVELVEQRCAVVYYPLYRVILHYAGRDYPVTIDAVTGEVIAARLPESDRVRAPLVVGFSLWVGLLLGLVLRAAVYAGGEPRHFFQYLFFAGSGTGNVLVLGFFGMLAALTLTLAVLSIAWDHLRYEGEYVVRGTTASFERIGRPPRTALDKLSAALAEFINAGWKSAARNQERRMQ